MQLRVAKVLNQILVIIFVVIVALAAALFFLLLKMPDLKWVFLGSFILLGIALFTVYRWLEQSWDKRVITRMAQAARWRLLISGAPSEFSHAGIKLHTLLALRIQRRSL